MKKPLCEVLFASEKRKQVLLLLHRGIKQMEDILSALDTNRQALLPQIRILEEHYLVSRNKDAYELTTIGEMLVEKMLPLLGTVETLGTDIDYWGAHDLSFMPLHLSGRINQLAKCEVRNPSIAEMYELNPEVLSSSYRSKSLFKIISLFHPQYSHVFHELIRHNVSIFCILSNELYQQLLENQDNTLKSALRNELVHLFVYPEEFYFSSITYNDYFVIMRLLKNNGEADKRYVLCSASESLEWAKDLFEYYMENSMPLTEI